MDELTFIETQFPVSKLSKESYKERKANYSQTLTGLGKWWGRKPLIMIRAAILGLLMPTSEDPRADREVFLKLLTMDEDGLWRRKTKNIPLQEIYVRLKAAERLEWFAEDTDPANPRLKKGTKAADREQLQRLVFSRLNYDEKLTYCDRPEQIDGPTAAAWAAINAHLGTHAASLPQLVWALGKRRFGHTPRIGDAFCGGGSVPFEAARISCEAYGADLNPVAALLTWAALNIVGGGEEVAKQVREAQVAVYEAVDRQITEWGIEHNDQGWRADAYLYCTETRCPECGWMVPLAPSWVIGEKTHTVVVLVPDEERRRFDIDIRQGVTKSALAAARVTGTVRNSRLECPHCRESTPMTAIRGDRRGGGGTEYGLRLWENDDLVPRPDDVFQERLYCIRWVETVRDAQGKDERIRHYRAPDAADLEREEQALQLLRERFAEWQAKGYIPSRRIEPGDETTRLMRERGWTHWHHLFTPRQLLVHGFILSLLERERNLAVRVGILLGVGKCANWNSKLCQWIADATKENGGQTFTNQALNTLLNYYTRPVELLETSFLYELKSAPVAGVANAFPMSVLGNLPRADIWLTDPPYADAINYNELSEFFLAWYEKHLPRLFPDWYTDSKRALAIRGSGKEFRHGMVDAYRNLAAHMPDDGLQIVMFTHQDASVWADLTLILWAAGLRVTAAWTIATETESALKEGNYVQGTVLMVLRKQTAADTAFLDELVPEVEVQVERQLASMLALDDQEDPNFSDADYQLAAYAAALRVLTKYKNIEDIDVAYELSREQRRGEASPIEWIIEDAVRTASNYLVPKGLTDHLWKRLGPEEKLYLKGLEVEAHGDYRSGVYQEFARGFGVRDYRFMLQTGKANATRLKTASEFKRRELGESPFGGSLVRHALYAVWRTVETGETRDGLTWLRTEVPDYWGNRKALVAILRYLSKVEIEHWQADSHAARLVAGAVDNDHV